MSNVSGGSTGSSSSRGRGRFFGIPQRCWCGHDIVALISKSDSNPFRRYFRCAYAADKKLSNDNHIFKWIDEAILNEIERLISTSARLDGEMKEFEKGRLITKQQEDMKEILTAAMKMKVEEEMTEILERVKDEIVAAKSTMKKMVLLVVLICMITVVCSQLLA